MYYSFLRLFIIVLLLFLVPKVLDASSWKSPLNNFMCIFCSMFVVLWAVYISQLHTSCWYRSDSFQLDFVEMGNRSRDLTKVILTSLELLYSKLCGLNLKTILGCLARVILNIWKIEFWLIYYGNELRMNDDQELCPAYRVNGITNRQHSQKYQVRYGFSLIIQ